MIIMMICLVVGLGLIVDRGPNGLYVGLHDDRCQQVHLDQLAEMMASQAKTCHVTGSMPTCGMTGVDRCIWINPQR